MKKNYKIHLVIDKELAENLKKSAEENNISIAENCRQKLREDSQLKRIELMIEKILNKDGQRNSN